MFLLNPYSPDHFFPDERSRQIMLQTIAIIKKQAEDQIDNNTLRNFEHFDFIGFHQKLFEWLGIDHKSWTPLGDWQTGAGCPD